MVIEYNKKIKVVNPKPYLNGGKSKPNPTLGKPNPNTQQIHVHEKDDPTEDQPPETSTQTMVHECLTECGTDPSDIHDILSVFNAKGGNSPQDSTKKIQVHQRHVFARANLSTNHLIDREGNGRLAGADMRILQKTHWKINIVGIDDHELTGLNVVSAAALLDTQKGPMNGIIHEYAHLGKAKSIHAAGQMEWFNCKVDDRSKVVLETSDGYVIPLSIKSGLFYMHSIRISTDNDLQLYPHVIFTSLDTWGCFSFGSWYYTSPS